jgi:hypothetical protein
MGPCQIGNSIAGLARGGSPWSPGSSEGPGAVPWRCPRFLGKLSRGFPAVPGVLGGSPAVRRRPRSAPEGPLASLGRRSTNQADWTFGRLVCLCVSCAPKQPNNQVGPLAYWFVQLTNLLVVCQPTAQSTRLGLWPLGWFLELGVSRAPPTNHVGPLASWLVQPTIFFVSLLLTCFQFSISLLLASFSFLLARCWLAFNVLSICLLACLQLSFCYF